MIRFVTLESAVREARFDTVVGLAMSGGFWIALREIVDDDGGLFLWGFLIGARVIRFDC